VSYNDERHSRRWTRRARFFVECPLVTAEGEFAERPCDVDAILPPEVCERLAEVKRHWDPDGLIRANHAVAIAPV
jgi:hypothetical protein